MAIAKSDELSVSERLGQLAYAIDRLADAVEGSGSE
jgi:hypothetical protein